MHYPFSVITSVLLAVLQVLKDEEKRSLYDQVSLSIFLYAHNFVNKIEHYWVLLMTTAYLSSC